MKKLIEVEEKSGLESLMGECVVLYCLNYIYSGRLIGVDDACALLEDAEIVYETGPLKDTEWKYAEKLRHEHYVKQSCIESFGKR